MKDGCTVYATAGESYHFAVIGAAGVRTSRRKVVVDICFRDEEIVGKQDLRVGSRLVGEENDESRSFFE